MGITTQERNISNPVGRPTAQHDHQRHQGHEQPPTSVSQGKGTEVQPGQTERRGEVTAPAIEAQCKRVNGYQQDMVMFMDKEVAKPETYGLPTLDRLLYGDDDDGARALAGIIRGVTLRVREGITEAPRELPVEHNQHE